MTASTMQRVAILGAYPVVNLGVASLIASLPGFCVAAAGSWAPDAVASMMALSPDIVLLHLDAEGIFVRGAVCRLFQRDFTSANVIAISASSRDPALGRICGGAISGVVEEDALTESLPLLLRAVADGYICWRVGSPIRSRHLDCLTAREYEIFKAIASGARGKELARRLAISHKTVSTHKGRILAKLGLQNELDIARLSRSLDAPSS
ncbi:LuxR C-terminal-related transcriptional regulator [Uliginosibacterium sp. sgz301328]|uniref:LuxR C-terminal-related transcriptional regulator n=1 Tax=Uliginosibacterium sp. sgz301328 TaxID=3243764 RepID=UPI00359E79F0